MAVRVPGHRKRPSGLPEQSGWDRGLRSEGAVKQGKRRPSSASRCLAIFAAAAAMTLSAAPAVAQTTPALPEGCGADDHTVSQAFTRVTSSNTTITVTFGDLSDHASSTFLSLVLCRPNAAGTGYETAHAKDWASPNSPATDTTIKGFTIKVPLGIALTAGTDYWVRVDSVDDDNLYRSPWFYIRTAGVEVTIAGGSEVTEGTAAQFTVTANFAPSADLTVYLEVAETLGSDYVAAADEGSKTVTIAANTTTAALSVTTNADSTDEPHGSVTVRMATGNTGYTVGLASFASVSPAYSCSSPKVG